MKKEKQAVKKVSKKQKFKNCFIDEKIDFNYSVEDEDGDWIADVHALTPKDMSYIRRHSFTSVTTEDGTPRTEVDEFLYDIALIKTAVDKWVFDRDITFDEVNLLDKAYRTLIAKEIMTRDNIFKTNQSSILEN